MSYTVAVIGCGVIGKRLGAAFKAHEEIKLKYAVDVNREKLDDYCRQFGTKGFGDYLQVLEQGDLDIVYVGVPPKWHEQITVEALNAGKHVICEKPISTSAASGRKMTEAAEGSGKVTAVNFVFTHMPSFHRMRDMVTNGELGEIKDVEIKIRMPRWPRSWQDVAWLLDHDQGGPLREIGSHFIYAAQKIFGPVEVTESDFELSSPTKFEKRVEASFTTGGIQGNIDLLTLCDEEEQNTLYITGSEGKIRFRDWYILETWDERSGKWHLTDDHGVNASAELVTQFVNAIEGNSATNLVSFEEATSVQQVIDDIFSS